MNGTDLDFFWQIKQFRYVLLKSTLGCLPRVLLQYLFICMHMFVILLG